jgi:hypothetical protein
MSDYPTQLLNKEVRRWRVTMTVRAFDDVNEAKIMADMERWTGHIYDSIEVREITGK